MNKILLVDDEPDIVEFLKYNLEKENYNVIESYNGTQALQKLSENPDLILLDIMMPDMDGFEVCRHIKENNSCKDIPVIFLTALSRESDEIKGLELGAVDFIRKPISPQKFIARVNSNLRNRTGHNSKESGSIEKLAVGKVLINPVSYKVFIDGSEMYFPKKEFQLFHFLASNPERVFSREELLKRIWGDEVYVVDRTIDVHVRKIRQKLKEFSGYIGTVKGIGYKFQTQNY